MDVSKVSLKLQVQLDVHDRTNACIAPYSHVTMATGDQGGIERKVSQCHVEKPWSASTETPPH